MKVRQNSAAVYANPMLVIETRTPEQETVFPAFVSGGIGIVESRLRQHILSGIRSRERLKDTVIRLVRYYAAFRPEQQ